MVNRMGLAGQIVGGERLVQGKAASSWKSLETPSENYNKYDQSNTHIYNENYEIKNWFHITLHFSILRYNKQCFTFKFTELYKSPIYRMKDIWFCQKIFIYYYFYLNFLIQFGPHLVPVFVVCACDVFGAPIPTPHYTFQWLLDPFSIENKRIYNSNTNLPRRNGTVGTKRDARPQQYNNVSIYLSMSLYIYIGKHDLYPFLLCSISGCCAAPHYMDQQENVSGSVCLFTCVFIRHSTMHTSRCFPHISVWMCGGRVRGQPTSP